MFLSKHPAHDRLLSVYPMRPRLVGSPQHEKRPPSLRVNIHVGLIQQKRADGYHYEFEAYMLHHFDQFCLDQGDDPGGLTRDVVMAWAEQRPAKSKNYRNQRVSFVRQLAQYMISLSCPAYIPPTFASNAMTVPHTLSSDELREFYLAVDHFHPRQAKFQRFAASYSVLFRLFYCCGLRLSEGCYLRRAAVNGVQPTYMQKQAIIG